MELQAVMEKRRSIRNYNPERKVTKEQLEELIKAASYAPSWKNLQTSRYYCVLSENAVKELIPRLVVTKITPLAALEP